MAIRPNAASLKGIVKKIVLFVSFALAVGFSATFQAQATPVFARKEKKVCAYCHLNPGGGGTKGFRGLYYKGHALSFKKYLEATEAKKAGVKPNAMGKDAKPKKPYTGK